MNGIITSITERRPRTMPWMVTFFFILVVPLGLTHVVLVISQPVLVGAWCTVCLAAAVARRRPMPTAVGLDTWSWREFPGS